MYANIEFAKLVLSQSDGQTRSMCPQRAAGFSLIELVTVLLILGVLASTATTVLIPSRTFQLQSSRDMVVMTLSAAQQRAMYRISAVQVIVGAGQIDMREDTNGNGSFTDEASLNVGGVQYPLALQASQNITAATFNYDRLGQTQGNVLTLLQNTASVSVTVTDSGYAY